MAVFTVAGMAAQSVPAGGFHSGERRFVAGVNGQDGDLLRPIVALYKGLGVLCCAVNLLVCIIVGDLLRIDR